MSSSAWSLSSMKVLRLQQCGSEVSVTNHRALGHEIPSDASVTLDLDDWNINMSQRVRQKCQPGLAKALSSRLGRLEIALAIFALGANARHETAAGNCSTNATWRFRMRFSAAVHALMPPRRAAPPLATSNRA